MYEKKPARSDLHPTMKPVALFGRLITNSSKYGDTVADFFGRSGTTLIACEQLNRSAYLMELNEGKGVKSQPQKSEKSPAAALAVGAYS